MRGREPDKAARGVAESGPQLQATLDAIEDGILGTDPETRRFVAANSAMCRMLGYTREELLALGVGDIHPSEDLPVIAKLLGGIPREGLSVPATLRLKRKDGSVFHADINGRHVLLGERECLLGTFRDITDRRRADRALQETQKRLEEAQRVARVGSWELDVAKDVITGSAEFFRLFDASPKQLGRLSQFVERLHPDDRERVQSDVDNALRQDRPYDTDYRVKLRDDGWRNINARGQVFAGADGKPVRMTGTCLDITDRVRADEAVRASENLYRTLVSALPDAVTMTDLEGIVTYSSPRALELHGFSGPEETIGIKSFELIAPEDRERAAANLMKTLADGRVENAEYALLRKDGTRFPAELSATVIRNAGGEPKAFIAITRDISTRKRLEAQLRQAQKMEAVGTLAGGVAHEFNNLLTVITGYTGLLLAEITQEGPARKRLKRIQTSADRAAALVNHLLAFSRRSVVQPRLVGLGDTVAGMEAGLRELAGRGVEVEVKIDPAAGSVMADPHQIAQVVTGLSGNARDAMPDGGRLTIEVANAELTGQEAGMRLPANPGPYVMLAVRDTGTGMDEATKVRIFEPFFTTKGVGGGMGLGLSAVLGIVQQTGGTISVDSAPGRGSTFRVYLPRVPAAVASASG